MAKSTKDLKREWQDAEDEAINLQNEKDAAIDKVRAKYGKRQRTAVDKAAKAQKAYLDAEAADALRDRPDGAAVADALGLTL
jgi:ElaB/YqjD/DUF883 family membrane-anchored ribosome-binding protein